MKLKSLSLTLATTALVALSIPSFAQEADKSGQNVSTATVESEQGAAATLALAYELYAVGVASEDALTVLTAAKLAASAELDSKEPAALDPAAFDAEGLTLDTFRARKAAPGAPAAPAPVMNDGETRPAAVATFGADMGDDDGAAALPPTSAEMFAKATELAGDDEALKEIIADAQAETSRGRIGGAVSWLSRLNAGKMDIWEVPFYGNSYAEIAVVGDGDSNLDMVLTDENGNVICYDTSRSDQVYCDFVPAWDGYFYVAVENTGGKRNSYYLLTN
jgi:hypothetical protein